MFPKLWFSREDLRALLTEIVSPFSCWVVLRCGSGKISGKVVGGLKAKCNKGITGSAFCLSIYLGPPSWQTPNLPPSSSQEEWLIILPMSYANRTRDSWWHRIFHTRKVRKVKRAMGQKTCWARGCWRPILESGLPAQGSHSSRQLQETAGLYNEKGGNEKFNVGFLGRKETDLPHWSRRGS